MSARVQVDDARTVLADVERTGPHTGRATIDGRLALVGLTEGRWSVWGWIRPVGEQDLRGTALEGVITR